MTITIIGSNITGAVILGGDPPGPPTGVTAGYPTSSTAIVSFTPPANSGSTAISSYTAISSPGNISVTVSSGEITVTGLSSDTSYTFTVYATNSFGNSVPSNTSNTIRTTPVVGQSYAGGYFVGQISTSANGVATHNLVIAPKATGYYSSSNETSGKVWGPDAAAGATSEIDGPSNTAYIVSHYSGAAANWVVGLNIGGYSDWYLPAICELEVFYYNFRPYSYTGSTGFGVGNSTTSGANPYSVPPRNYYYSLTTNPVQTTVDAFKYNGSEWANENYYWSSTYNGVAGSKAKTINFGLGYLNGLGQMTNWSINSYNVGTRAFRRVAI